MWSGRSGISSRLRLERGQASVALVAAVPVVVVAALVLIQVGVVGWSAWSTANAARAAGRAAVIGEDPQRAAERALPPILRSRIRRVDAGAGPIGVSLRAPALPGLLPAQGGRRGFEVRTRLGSGSAGAARGHEREGAVR